MRVAVLRLPDEMLDGEYVVISKENWTSLQGELMARPKLMKHIGPIMYWRFDISGAVEAPEKETPEKETPP